MTSRITQFKNYWEEKPKKKKKGSLVIRLQPAAWQNIKLLCYVWYDSKEEGRKRERDYGMENNIYNNLFDKKEETRESKMGENFSNRIN